MITRHLVSSPCWEFWVNRLHHDMTGAMRAGVVMLDSHNLTSLGSNESACMCPRRKLHSADWCPFFHETPRTCRSDLDDHDGDPVDDGGRGKGDGIVIRASLPGVARVDARRRLSGSDAPLVNCLPVSCEEVSGGRKPDKPSAIGIPARRPYFFTSQMFL